MDNLEIKPIRSLLDSSFYIPSYQRGYRWTPQEVVELLDDINDFMNKNKNTTDDSFYCIQPLVVKEMVDTNLKETFYQELDLIKDETDFFTKAKDILHKYTKWEVIDGQQRLTTIFLILKYLHPGSTPYLLEYQTRDADSNSEINAATFLANINNTKYESNRYDTIDYHHFYEAFSTIRQWFSDKDDSYKQTFQNCLMDFVRFIWYRSEGEKAIKVFTRLNIGKISLTNAELIKAIFLNKSNFIGLNKEQLLSEQTRIATQWDQIEFALQNEELWLFIHELGYERPTRIDFIFDIICNENRLGVDVSKIGNDDYRTFRYFAKYFKDYGGNPLNAISKCWAEVSDIFNVIMEWYNDIVLYHYVGYLINCRCDSLSSLMNKWKNATDKKSFVNNEENGLKKSIKDRVSKCYDAEKGLANTVYDLKDKTQCRDLLLLHNIQSVIAQNNELLGHDNYRQGIYYKFPFHLYKKEHWDIEHVDSYTENPLENPMDQKEWLRYALISGRMTDDQKQKIIDFLNTKNKDIKSEDFKNLKEDIEESLGVDKENRISEESEKNMIWNYVLLDSSTNRGYGNSIFPAKRRVIIGKERGIKFQVVSEKDELVIHPNEHEEHELIQLMALSTLTSEQEKRMKELLKYSAIAFIPPCTKSVFMKYYTTEPNNLLVWDKNDAKAYLQNINNLLFEFIR